MEQLNPYELTRKIISLMNPNNPIPISYSTLAEMGYSKKLPNTYFLTKTLGDGLDRVQELCSSEEFNVPCLAAMVVHKNGDKLPGKGFYVSYFNHNKNHCVKDPDNLTSKERERLVLEEQARVIEYREWEDLLNKLKKEQASQTGNE